ncbi:hypothetical protein PSEUDO9AZ_30026 [Pseudomonas sp. 9AZ]|nr:hypothetical protein PSEUDO9AZ_30026 [Pseudomonas sp. 9AZ]
MAVGTPEFSWQGSLYVRHRRQHKQVSGHLVSLAYPPGKLNKGFVKAFNAQNETTTRNLKLDTEPKGRVLLGLRIQ